MAFGFLYYFSLFVFVYSRQHLFVLLVTYLHPPNGFISSCKNKSCFHIYYIQRQILLCYCIINSYLRLKDNLCAFQEGVGCSEWR